jgi:AGZA family xanthine/uracil permease-like MFS transporter
VPAFLSSDTWIQGAFALEQGFIFSSMILAAATVAVIEHRFRTAAVWCGIAAGLSALGLMHAYRWTPTDTVLDLRPAWAWAAGYGLMALTFLLARWITVPRGDRRPV